MGFVPGVNVFTGDRVKFRFDHDSVGFLVFVFVSLPDQVEMPLFGFLPGSFSY